MEVCKCHSVWCQLGDKQPHCDAVLEPQFTKMEGWASASRQVGEKHINKQNNLNYP